MYAEFHLSAKVLFGVHVGRGSEGVIEEDESVPLHVEGQVGTRGEEVILSIQRCERAIVSHMEKPQPWDIEGGKDRMHEDVTWTVAKEEHYRDRCEIYGHWADFSYRIHRSASLEELQNPADSPSLPWNTGGPQRRGLEACHTEASNACP